MRRKKRAITLLEIMIAIFLIGLVGGVLGYNIKGSLDRGKKFKTEMGMEKLKEAILLELSTNHSVTAAQIADNPKKYLKDSVLIKDIDKMLVDGWGEKYIITAEGQNISVVSPGLEHYLANQKK